jgi:Diacylglycerol kinase catalytic domain
VAQVLAGSGTALGLLPTGTANLLARNLAIELDNTVQATRIALSGSNRAIDVGRLIIDDRTEEQVFLVMAGMSFDAAIMAGASHELKARLGSLAYFVSGARAEGSAHPDHPCRGRPARSAPSSPYGGGRQLRQASRRAGVAARGQGGRRAAGCGDYRAEEHFRMTGGDRAGAGSSPPWPPDSAALARPHHHDQRGGSAAGPTRRRSRG